ncbi:MAG: IS21 family transposase [Planctomycetota bacterium]|jgi:transposase
MKVGLWAEIRRLHEVQRLSDRGIAQQLRCCTKTVRKALCMDEPPRPGAKRRGSILDPYTSKIDGLLEKYPRLSAVRILEEISRAPDGYPGKIDLVRNYLRKVRPARGRVYREVEYDPADAMQVDWGHCGIIRVGSATRRLSVFVAVLCFSRLIYIAFTLSQRKAEFYRCTVDALLFFGASPKKIIIDNLRAAVLSGHGRTAVFHPEFLALCGHFGLEPIACERADPESKGVVEGGVRYVKGNALAGRDEELRTYEDYQRLAVTWRDETANVRPHDTTGERPLDRFEKERPHMRPLPAVPFDTDEDVVAVASPQARVRFDANRYSVPPEFARKTVLVKASRRRVQILYEGQTITEHPRSYDRGQKVVLQEHDLAVRRARRPPPLKKLEATFAALGDEARVFLQGLLRAPVQPAVHIRRLLGLVRLYGRAEVLPALGKAAEYRTYDSAYVESLIQQERRRRQLPSPTTIRPQRAELIEEIEVEEPDPGAYDRIFQIDEEEES